MIKQRALAIFLSVLAVCWVLAWSLPVTTLFLGELLESRHPYKDPKDLPRADVIVVFGGKMNLSRFERAEAFLAP
jgi:uncharacterized SAM-binding protein YcdF (DUF218 family)